MGFQASLAALAFHPKFQFDIRLGQGALPALRPFHQPEPQLGCQILQAEEFQLAGLRDPVQIQVRRFTSIERVAFDQGVGRTLDSAADA